MIEIKNLKKSFGETVACNIAELTIADGAILGLVGNNGAGKTTLFRLMLDLLSPDEGSVAIDGVNPAATETWKDFVGAYIDDGFLIDYLTPDEYFAFIGKICNLSQDAVNERLSRFESFFGGEICSQNKIIRNLSAGNKQKVGIAGALLRNPRVVVLDEPFNFLDPTSQNVLKHLLQDYNRQTGATVLLSSHNLQHTTDISTSVALLEKGCVIGCFDNVDGSADNTLRDYFEGKTQPPLSQENKEDEDSSD